MKFDSGNYVIAKATFAIAIGVAMYFMVHPVLVPFIWIPIAAAVAWRGDWEARIVALSVTIGIAVQTAGPRMGLYPHLYDTTQTRAGVLTVDGLICAVVLVVAVRSRRWWPSWAAAFNGLVVVSHLIFMARRDAIQPWAYMSSVVIFSWFEFILLAFVAFDVCVRPRLAPPPRPTTLALLLFGLLAFLPILPSPRQVDPVSFEMAEVAWLLVILTAFALWNRRPAHV